MSKSSKSWIVQLAIAAGVSFLIVGFMFKTLASGLSGEERSRILSVLRTVSFGGLGLYLIASISQAFVRSERFRLLIRSSEGSAPSRLHAMLVTLVRNMTVDMLPSRVGELSYVALMNRGCRVSGEACVSSLSISFLFDLIAREPAGAGLEVL